MTNSSTTASAKRAHCGTKASRLVRRKRIIKIALLTSGLILALVATGAWLAVQASRIQSNLNAISALVPQLKEQVTAGDAASSQKTVGRMKELTASARSAATDPLWTLASGLPWIGANFSAISEVATTADDVVNRAVAPLTGSIADINWSDLAPVEGVVDISQIKAAAPQITAASHTIELSHERLSRIERGYLLPAVSSPLDQATEQLGALEKTLKSAADAVALLPSMMGSTTPRSYLVLIQNSAEIRATGGIPGALAVLTVDGGKISLSQQESAVSLGAFSPPMQIPLEQEVIYTKRLGRYVQDINLTPDFPSVAATAKSMWETARSSKVDGVISIDPVALSYVLKSTGPVTLSGDLASTAMRMGLPSALNSGNVVQTLLSDSYAKIEDPKDQDSYFAAVATEVFAGVTSGKADAKSLVDALVLGAREKRVLLWSAVKGEQEILSANALGGAVTGSSVAPASFGVYFNDGTGAKMDYYVKRTVQLIKECPKDGYEQTTVRISSTNTAPPNAAEALPGYVTGEGTYGVPPGSVQTNVIAYGPVQANVERAKRNDQPTEFASYLHGNRPVGVIAVRLAPGESTTVEFTFGKIVQHTEPTLDVTPTIFPVKDVMRATENPPCS